MREAELAKAINRLLPTIAAALEKAKVWGGCVCREWARMGKVWHNPGWGLAGGGGKTGA